MLKRVRQKINDSVEYVYGDLTAVREEVADRYIEAVQTISHTRCSHPLDQRRASCVAALPDVSLDGLNEISEAVHRDSGVHSHRHDVVTTSKFWKIAKAKFVQKGSESLPKCVLEILVPFETELLPKALPIPALFVRQTCMSDESSERESWVSLDKPGGVIHPYGVNSDAAEQLLASSQLVFVEIELEEQIYLLKALTDSELLVIRLFLQERSHVNPLGVRILTVPQTSDIKVRDAFCGHPT
ncbi:MULTISPECIES: hypothetical protein [unclassified Rhodococcus (in: high G+C Gram-positive bacteria)]|uniref:hypothetical protein n=1 Tax=unclassified Rhodococcus (in: high G+C Gram-positive bacteria) TaxID=192944 RepID=UPI001FFB972A|nr:MULTISPECIES: hypothetical protein [unclassified Rhodococcus (in: high G+C Gram-positive bacteria)]